MSNWDLKLLLRWDLWLNFYIVIKVPRRISNSGLLVSTDPVPIDDELILIDPRVRHRDEKLPLMVANSLHLDLLPLGKGARDANMLTASSPLE